jgi:prevent-host-death family protein
VQVKLSTQVKPISYLKAHAAELLQELRSGGEPLVITQHGVAKAVLQDIASYEKTQETLALLKILALAERQIEKGEVVPAEEVYRRIRGKHRTR